MARAGHDVTVLERRSEFTELGAGIQLAPNAFRPPADRDDEPGPFALGGDVPKLTMLFDRFTGLADRLTDEEADAGRGTRCGPSCAAAAQRLPTPVR